MNNDCSFIRAKEWAWLLPGPRERIGTAARVKLVKLVKLVRLVKPAKLAKEFCRGLQGHLRWMSCQSENVIP